MQRIIIFANGELPDIEKARAILKDDDYIICADGGTRHASALDLMPALVVGDLDSADSAALRSLQADGVPIERHPRDKDETDLELAINKAVELDPKEIVILAALGGRLDQTLANIALLSNLQLVTFNLKLDDGVEEILFCRDQVQVKGRSGDIVSLIPWSGEVTGVQTENLKWQLNSETLHPEKTRGISNEMTDDTATVKIQAGLLLVIHRRQSQIVNHKSKITSTGQNEKNNTSFYLFPLSSFLLCPSACRTANADHYDPRLILRQRRGGQGI